MSSEAEPILAGVRVVEMCTGIPGPVAGLLLAEAGADVIKVERPRGDPMRVSPGFRTWNRSKRGVVLDLDREPDRADFFRLLGTADVLLHGFRPSQAALRGLADAQHRLEVPGDVDAERRRRSLRRVVPAA